MDEEVNGHICLYLLGEEIHCDLVVLPENVAIAPLAEYIGYFVQFIITEHFNANAQRSSIQ